MSLFGTSPPGNDEPTTVASPGRNRSGRGGLFDDGEQKTSSSGLFADEGDNGDDSPWSMPTPRKQQSRADMVRNLLPAADVPDSYIEAFDTMVRQGGEGQAVSSDGLAKLFAAARLPDPSTQSRIVSLVAPDTSGDSVSLGRNEFNVVLALAGLAQEGEIISLDGVDERRKSKSCSTICIESTPLPWASPKFQLPIDGGPARDAHQSPFARLSVLSLSTTCPCKQWPPRRWVTDWLPQL